MKHYKRSIKILNLLQNKSFFLFGPRSAGKTTLIRDQLASGAIIIDLLKSHLLTEFSKQPESLEEHIELKSTQRVSEGDFKGLRRLQEEQIFKKFYLISQDSFETTKHQVTCYHWRSFLSLLWQDKIIEL